MKVFISYRRADGEGMVRKLFDFMAPYLGKDKVFMDVASGIPIGSDFRQRLIDEVAKADALLAVIGPNWLRTIQEKAADPNDFVRVEIEAALQRKILIIPLLIGNQVPSEEQLPPSIAGLSSVRGFTFDTGADFRRQAKKLGLRLKACGRSWRDVGSITFVAVMGWFTALEAVAIGRTINDTFTFGYIGWGVGCTMFAAAALYLSRHVPIPFNLAYVASALFATVHGFLFVGLTDYSRKSFADASWHFIFVYSISTAILALAGAIYGWMRCRQKAKF